jgi:hypothetical protein
MTTVHLAAADQERLRRRSRLRRDPLLLGVILCALVAAMAILLIPCVLWSRWPAPAPQSAVPALPITVAGVAFNLPAASIRVQVQRRPGAHERVDLAFLWPSLQPPDPSNHQSLRAPSAVPSLTYASERIFVTIAAAGDTLAPDDRLLTIYPRYVNAQALPGPDGLTLVAFREDTPYRGEDLIFDAAASGFAVRCTRNGVGLLPGVCLHERRIGSAEVVLRFPRDWLENWRIVLAKIDRLIESISE